MLGTRDPKIKEPAKRATETSTIHGSQRAMLPLKDCPDVSSITITAPGFDALTVDEQIDYLQSLWNRIAAKPEQVPVPDWHREILAQRLATLRGSTDEGKTWDQFDRELTAELQSKPNGSNCPPVIL